MPVFVKIVFLAQNAFALRSGKSVIGVGKNFFTKEAFAGCSDNPIVLVRMDRRTKNSLLRVDRLLRQPNHLPEKSFSAFSISQETAQSHKNKALQGTALCRSHMIRCIGLFFVLGPLLHVVFGIQKKIISFRENFWPGKPSKTVISPISETMKNGHKALYHKTF